LDATAEKKDVQTSFDFIDSLGQTDSFSTVEQFNEHIMKGILQNPSLHLFKKGITPVWEDPHNEKGGKFVIHLRDIEPEKVHRLWVELAQTLIEGSLDPADSLCGIVIASRSWGTNVTVWNRRADEVQSIKTMKYILKNILKVSHVKYITHATAISKNKGVLHPQVDGGKSGAVGTQENPGWRSQMHRNPLEPSDSSGESSEDDLRFSPKSQRPFEVLPKLWNRWGKPPLEKPKTPEPIIPEEKVGTETEGPKSSWKGWQKPWEQRQEALNSPPPLEGATVSVPAEVNTPPKKGAKPSPSSPSEEVEDFWSSSLDNSAVKPPPVSSQEVAKEQKREDVDWDLQKQVSEEPRGWKGWNLPQKAPVQPLVFEDFELFPEKKQPPAAHSPPQSRPQPESFSAPTSSKKKKASPPSSPVSSPVKEKRVDESPVEPHIVPKQSETPVELFPELPTNKPTKQKSAWAQPSENVFKNKPSFAEMVAANIPKETPVPIKAVVPVQPQKPKALPQKVHKSETEVAPHQNPTPASVDEQEWNEVKASSFPDVEIQAGKTEESSLPILAVKPKHKEKHSTVKAQKQEITKTPLTKAKPPKRKKKGTTNETEKEKQIKVEEKLTKIEEKQTKVEEKPVVKPPLEKPVVSPKEKPTSHKEKGGVVSCTVGLSLLGAFVAVASALYYSHLHQYI